MAEGRMDIKDWLWWLHEQYMQKNYAYGNSMSENFKEYGKVAYVLRISDKLNRLESLLNDANIPAGDESIDDTIGDAVTYCLMCVGDIAAKPIVDDFTGGRNINERFTSELLNELIENLQIIKNVSNDFIAHAPDNYFKDRCGFENGDFLHVINFKLILKESHNLNQLAQGCYLIACLLIFAYSLTEKCKFYWDD